MATRYELTAPRALEAESVHVLREVAATFERPVLLVSGDERSTVLRHLAAKAFWPAPPPFPMLPEDTGHDFDVVLDSARRTQPPMPWNVHNGQRRPGERVRVFPLAAWTEPDVRQYVSEEGHASQLQLLRLATAGAVHAGKSALVGNLLAGQPATAKRQFVIADPPGRHTRDMVAGASTADLALIVVDARKGMVEQTRRHAFLTSLLGVPHVVVCVTKMDLAGWSRERFEDVRAEFRRYSAKLSMPDLAFIPVSASHGDNIAHRGESMPWYEGTSLLHHLEEVHISSNRNLVDARFPVQYVVRHKDFHGYAGTVAGGVFKPGDEVLVLPSGATTTVSAIRAAGRPVTEAFPPQAVTLELADALDVSRGDLICRPNNRPHTGQDIDAMVCWLTGHSELRPDATYTATTGTQTTQASVTSLDYRLDLTTQHRDETAQSLSRNEIGRVKLRTGQPLMFDAHRRNRACGSFVLVDDDGDTVAAGVITGPAQSVVWHSTAVRRTERGPAGRTIWLTGLSASGKSSVAVELERRLVAAGRPAYLLDGDNLRHGLNADLGFTAADRSENVRRVGEVARLFADAGVVAVVSLISPYRADRDRVRAAHGQAGLAFMEVFVDTPVETCEARDPKGMYAKARAGVITGFTGVDDPYEAPAAPELVLRPEHGDPARMAAVILSSLGQAALPRMD